MRYVYLIDVDSFGRMVVATTEGVEVIHSDFQLDLLCTRGILWDCLFTPQDLREPHKHSKSEQEGETDY